MVAPATAVEIDRHAVDDELTRDPGELLVVLARPALLGHASPGGGGVPHRGQAFDLEVQADVENVEKAGRSYKILREPFKPQPAGERTREPLTVHWTAVGPGDEVAAAGASREVKGERLVVDLAGRLKPGAYRVVLALALNGNLVNPEVKVLSYRAGD